VGDRLERPIIAWRRLGECMSTSSESLTPHLPVLHDHIDSVNLLREALLQHGFAALVEPVHSLDALSVPPGSLPP
jgi:hypothetical protein